MKKSLAVVMTLPMLLGAADLYLAGDSTMCDYAEKRAPLTGWGTALKSLVKPGVNVTNLAMGGRSSKSFLTEKRWDKILDSAKPGDFVIIQFGHNDAHKGAKNAYRHTEPDGEFQENLKRMISEVRAKKGVPVLMTQTAICRFRDGKQYNTPTEEGYIAATRKVAKATGTDLVDLNAWSAAKLTGLGQEKSLKLYLNLAKGESPNYPDGKVDDCHFHTRGARFYAAGMVECAKKKNLKLAKLFR